MFTLKDLGILSYFLGIEVLYANGEMYLSQKKYIRDLRIKAEMLYCKGIDTPMSTRLKLKKAEKEPLEKYIKDATNYKSKVGGLQYLILTKPEISFVVHKLSQYVVAPTLHHLMVGK